MIMGASGGEALLIADPALVGRRDLHILAVLRDRAPGHLNAFCLQSVRDLLVGQWMPGIFLLDHLFNAPLQDEQWGSGSRRALDCFGEEIPQFENALRRVGILARDSAADGRRMHADFLGYFLD